jgi:hypothetical protein
LYRASPLAKVRIPQPEKKRGCISPRGNARGTIGTGNAAEQDLTSIRRAYPTGIFGAVERKCVSLDLRAPECGLKALRETGRFSIEFERNGVTPKTLRHTSRLAFGGVA